MGLSGSINPSVGVAIGGKAATVQTGMSGALYALNAPLKGAITWTKVSGDANLSISGGKIVLAAGMAADAAQTIVVRAANGTTAVEFQVTLAAVGAAPMPVRALQRLASPSGDGSTGQTYTAPAGMTSIQGWYRESLTHDAAQTLVVGAAGSSIVSQVSDENFRLVVRGVMNGVLTDAVSLNVVVPPPFLIESFDDPANFTLSGGATLTADAVDKAQGAASLLMSATGTASAKIQKNNSIIAAPADFGVIACMADLGQDPERQSVQNLRMSLVYNGTEQYLANITTLGVTYQTPSTQFIGKYWNSYHVSEVPALASAASGTVGVAITHSGSTPNAAAIKLDAMVARSGGRPTLILDLDDLKVTQIATLFPYAQQRGVHFSVNVVKNYVDLDNTRLSLADLWTLYNAGNDMCCNGSIDDGPMTGKASVAAAIAELDECRLYLQGLGMNRGEAWRHFVYPNGTYQVPGAKILPSGNVTSTGSAVVTLGSTVNIVQGMLVAGFNVPSNTRVQSVDSATQLTLTQMIPAQAKPMSFTNDSGPFHTMKLPKAIAAGGIYKSGRTTLNRQGQHSRFGFGDRGLVMHGNGVTGRTLASIIAGLEQTELRGQTSIQYIHGILPIETGVDASEATVFGIIDWAVARRDAGALDILTKSQWYERDGRSVFP